MNTDTGNLKMFEDMAKIPPPYIPVNRILTIKERSDMKIQMYSPCACGSGKKFRFCCYTGNKPDVKFAGTTLLTK